MPFMKGSGKKGILLAAFVLVAISLSAACSQVEGLIPTPTFMNPLQFNYYSNAEIAGHYRKCLGRVDPRNPDTRWEAPVLATRHDRKALVEKNCACYQKYDRAFGYPGDVKPGKDPLWVEYCGKESVNYSQENGVWKKK